MSKSELFDAVSAGKVDLVKRLVRAGAALDTRNHYGQSVLVCAAASGHGKMIECLVSLGCNADERRNHTPLIVEAAYYGHVSVVRALIDCNAALEAADSSGRTAVVRAAEMHNLAVIKLLLAAGANVNARDKDDRSALVVAAKNAKLDIVKILFAKGANFDGALHATVAQAVSTAKWYPKSADKKDDRKRMENLLQVIALLVDRGVAIDQVLEKQLATVHKVLGVQATVAEALLQPAVLKKGWSAAVRRKLASDATRLDVALTVLTDERAVAHKDWPALVKELADAAQTYKQASKEAYGKAISRDEDDDGFLFDSWDLNFADNLDLALAILASMPAKKHKQWKTLAAYVAARCDECDYTPKALAKIAKR